MRRNNAKVRICNGKMMKEVRVEELDNGRGRNAQHDGDVALFGGSERTMGCKTRSTWSNMQF